MGIRAADEEAKAAFLDVIVGQRTDSLREDALKFLSCDLRLQSAELIEWSTIRNKMIEKECKGRDRSFR